VLSTRRSTVVSVDLPSLADVDKVLEIFTREETKLRASAPQAVSEQRDKPSQAAPCFPKVGVYIGHGHDPQWKTLRDFLGRAKQIETIFYEAASRAGLQTADEIQEMIKSADIAFMVHTGEDEDKAGAMHARDNVVDETGWSRGMHGSSRTIVLLEEGCTEYGNLKGTDQLRFPKGQIEVMFGDALLAILREFPHRL
jgi:predicted nucleotide-binding protein